ncbi:MAG TPA: hypothetical protein VHO28_06140 [Ignavibacteriales bacterium]|nr:hypothetical protein [Ignavibacteriales bacterium]
MELSLTLMAVGFAAVAVVTQFIIRMKELSVSKKKKENENLEKNIVYFIPSFVKYNLDCSGISEDDMFKFRSKPKFVYQETEGKRQVHRTADNNFYLVENSIFLN